MTTHKKHIKQAFCDEARPPSDTKAHAHAMGLDIDYYQAFLDDVDISDEQKIELIETLWQIVVNFIELGFQVHPLNMAQSDSGQSPAEKDETSRALERVIGEFASDALDVMSAYETAQTSDGRDVIEAPSLDDCDFESLDHDATDDHETTEEPDP